MTAEIDEATIARGPFTDVEIAAVLATAHEGALCTAFFKHNDDVIHRWTGTVHKLRGDFMTVHWTDHPGTPGDTVQTTFPGTQVSWFRVILRVKEPDGLVKTMAFSRGQVPSASRPASLHASRQPSRLPSPRTRSPAQQSSSAASASVADSIRAATARLQPVAAQPIDVDALAGDVEQRLALLPRIQDIEDVLVNITTRLRGAPTAAQLTVVERRLESRLDGLADPARIAAIEGRLAAIDSTMQTIAASITAVTDKLVALELAQRGSQQQHRQQQHRQQDAQRVRPLANLLADPLAAMALAEDERSLLGGGSSAGSFADPSFRGRFADVATWPDDDGSAAADHFFKTTHAAFVEGLSGAHRAEVARLWAELKAQLKAFARFDWRADPRTVAELTRLTVRMRAQRAEATGLAAAVDIIKRWDAQHPTVHDDDPFHDPEFLGIVAQCPRLAPAAAASPTSAAAPARGRPAQKQEQGGAPAPAAH